MSSFVELLFFLDHDDRLDVGHLLLQVDQLLRVVGARQRRVRDVLVLGAKPLVLVLNEKEPNEDDRMT